MKRVAHIAKNFQEAEEWDIEQQVNMTPQERMEVARLLRERYYRTKIARLREWKR